MEQKAAHTPAPWHFKKLAMHDGGHVVMFTAQNGQRTHRLDCAGEFKEADARLIAAAPTMYEYIASSASNGCASALKILEAIHAGA